MILSSIQAHPSMHSSYVQNIRTSSTFRKISTLTSPVASPFRTNPSLELYLLSLLKGEQKPCEERVSIGAEISALSDEQKIGLITFLKDIATRPAVEDCACKMLQCTKTQFAQVFLAQSDRTRLQVFLHDEDCVQKISTLWEKLYTDIIPTMEDIVFPLTLIDPCFSIRSLMLVEFRDRVIMPCLEHVEVSLPELEPILFSLLLETEGTPGFELFRSVTQKIKDDEEHGSFLLRPAPRAAMRKSSSAELVKTRSRTLPDKRKSVQWTDMRKSKTVSNF